MMYFVAYAVEMFRIGAVNAACHCWGYRNHKTSDQSRHNIVVGLLGMGFGWHNNHHADPRKLILTERWWEIDIEGYIGWLLSKTAPK
jgi:stearoyl-CoA desaturase (delta-9 desaturase)